MTHESACAVAQVLQRCPEARAEVLNVRHEVIWPDGSTISLHPCRQDGAASPLLRAMHHGGQWTLFDLKAVIPRDELDIRQAPTRDQVGLVMHALRRNFHNASAFLARVDRQHLARWPGEGRAPATRPCATSQGTGRPARAVAPSHHAAL